MEWPNDDTMHSIKVKQLPREEKEKVIDCVGYFIGCPQGQGNDSLIRIYKQYQQFN